jgi:hypothetical protein
MIPYHSIYLDVLASICIRLPVVAPLEYYKVSPTYELLTYFNTVHSDCTVHPPRVITVLIASLTLHIKLYVYSTVPHYRRLGLGHR